MHLHTQVENRNENFDNDRAHTFLLARRPFPGRRIHWKLAPTESYVGLFQLPDCIPGFFAASSLHFPTGPSYIADVVNNGLENLETDVTQQTILFLGKMHY